MIVTSGALAPTPMLNLLEHFSQITLIVSVDGIGQLNDYIRDGSCWADVVVNITRFQQMQNVTLTLAVTVQAYNMFQITEIADFALRQGLNLSCNMLREPDYLSCFAMPPLARAEAANRIRSYLAKRTELSIEFAATKEALIYTANCLEIEQGVAASNALTKFRSYTSDLDHAR